MARQKDRRERIALDVSEPIKVSELGSVRDDTVEDREDGVKGVGQVSARRTRRFTGRPLTLSSMQLIEAAAVYEPDWERAERIDKLMQHDGPGRRMQTNAMTMLLFDSARLEFESRAAKAERELGDPVTWARLCDVVEAAFPDRPERRLHPKPPTYKQYWNFRKKYLEDEVELRGLKRAEGIATARHLGLLDAGKGSVTHPSADNVVYGDSKVLNGMFNTPPIDPETGLPSVRRHDPDMHPYHKGDRQTGRRMVSACVRSDHFLERVMLDVTTMHVTDGSDGTRFTDMVLEMADLVPIQVANYDMALYAKNHDRLMEAGIAPVAKVQRNSKGQPGRVPLGDHTFKAMDGKEAVLEVLAVDGWPGITIATVEGVKWVALNPGQVKRAQNEDGTWRWWQYWKIRHLPEVPRQLRGAVAHIRHSWSKTDGDRSRSRALRLHPETSATYEELYRRRNDIESMHRHLQDLLFNERVSTVGDRNLCVWLHSYQTRVNRTALLAWHYRTGGDISQWFGKWRPPPKRSDLAA